MQEAGSSGSPAPVRQVASVQNAILDCWIITLKKNGTASCPLFGCDYQGKSIDEIQNHYLDCKELNPNIALECSFCGGQTDSAESSLNDHIQTAHFNFQAVISTLKESTSNPDRENEVLVSSALRKNAGNRDPILKKVSAVKCEAKDPLDIESEILLSRNSYVRKRAFHKAHLKSWGIFLEKDGYIRCHLQGCKFIAQSIEEMKGHYGYCNGKNSNAPFECPFCHGKTVTTELLNKHIERSHSDKAGVNAVSSCSNLETDSEDKVISNSFIKVVNMKVLLTEWRSNGYVRCPFDCNTITKKLFPLVVHLSSCVKASPVFQGTCVCGFVSEEHITFLHHTQTCDAIIFHVKNVNTYNFDLQVTEDVLDAWMSLLENEGFVRCNRCACLTFNVWTTVQHHSMCLKENSLAQKFTCSFCVGWTKSFLSLLQHIFFSHPVKSDYCFKNRPNNFIPFVGNENSYFKVEGKLICQYCEKQFDLVSSIQDHMIEYHDDIASEDNQPSLVSVWKAQIGLCSLCSCTKYPCSFATDTVLEMIRHFEKCKGVGKDHQFHPSPTAKRLRKERPAITEANSGELIVPDLIEEVQMESFQIYTKSISKTYQKRVRGPIKSYPKEKMHPRMKPTPLKVTIKAPGTPKPALKSKSKEDHLKKGHTEKIESSKKKSAETIPTEAKSVYEACQDEWTRLLKSKGSEGSGSENQDTDAEYSYSPADIVSCGTCGLEMTFDIYSKKHKTVHHGLCWIKGETPVNFNDEKLCLDILTNQQSQSKEHEKKASKFFRCFICQKVTDNALVHLNHIKDCLVKDKHIFLGRSNPEIVNRRRINGDACETQIEDSALTRENASILQLSSNNSVARKFSEPKVSMSQVFRSEALLPRNEIANPVTSSELIITEIVSVDERFEVDASSVINMEPEIEDVEYLIEDDVDDRFSDEVYDNSMECFERSDDSNEETDGLDERTDALDERTDALDERTDALSEETDGFNEETDGFNEETHALQEETEALSGEFVNDSSRNEEAFTLNLADDYSVGAEVDLEFSEENESGNDHLLSENFLRIEETNLDSKKNAVVESKTVEPKRISLAPRVLKPSDIVKCGLCKEEMMYSVYSKKHMEQHFQLCWIEGETPLNLFDEKHCVRILTKCQAPLLKSKKKNISKDFRCFKCGQTHKNAPNHLRHLWICVARSEARNERHSLARAEGANCGESTKTEKLTIVESTRLSNVMTKFIAKENDGITSVATPVITNYSPPEKVEMSKRTPISSAVRINELTPIKNQNQSISDNVALSDQKVLDQPKKKTDNWKNGQEKYDGPGQIAVNALNIKVALDQSRNKKVNGESNRIKSMVKEKLEINGLSEEKILFDRSFRKTVIKAQVAPFKILPQNTNFKNSNCDDFKITTEKSKNFSSSLTEISDFLKAGDNLGGSIELIVMNSIETRNEDLNGKVVSSEGETCRSLSNDVGVSETTLRDVKKTCSAEKTVAQCKELIESIAAEPPVKSSPETTNSPIKKVCGGKVLKKRVSGSIDWKDGESVSDSISPTKKTKYLNQMSENLKIAKDLTESLSNTNDLPNKNAGSGQPGRLKVLENFKEKSEGCSSESNQKVESSRNPMQNFENNEGSIESCSLSIAKITSSQVDGISIDPETKGSTVENLSESANPSTMKTNKNSSSKKRNLRLESSEEKNKKSMEDISAKDLSPSTSTSEATNLNKKVGRGRPRSMKNTKEIHSTNPEKPVDYDASSVVLSENESKHVGVAKVPVEYSPKPTNSATIKDGKRRSSRKQSFERVDERLASEYSQNEKIPAVSEEISSPSKIVGNLVQSPDELNDLPCRKAGRGRPCKNKKGAKSEKSVEDLSVKETPVPSHSDEKSLEIPIPLQRGARKGRPSRKQITEKDSENCTSSEEKLGCDRVEEISRNGKSEDSDDDGMNRKTNPVDPKPPRRSLKEKGVTKSVEEGNSSSKSRLTSLSNIVDPSKSSNQRTRRGRPPKIKKSEESNDSDHKSVEDDLSSEVIKSSIQTEKMEKGAKKTDKGSENFSAAPNPRNRITRSRKNVVSEENSEDVPPISPASVYLPEDASCAELSNTRKTDSDNAKDKVETSDQNHSNEISKRGKGKRGRSNRNNVEGIQTDSHFESFEIESEIQIESSDHQIEKPALGKRKRGTISNATEESSVKSSSELTGNPRKKVRQDQLKISMEESVTAATPMEESVTAAIPMEESHSVPTAKRKIGRKSKGSTKLENKKRNNESEECNLEDKVSLEEESDKGSSKKQESSRNTNDGNAVVDTSSENSKYAPSSVVKCGVCEKEMTYEVFNEKHRETHYKLCWIDGETPFDLFDNAKALSVLARYDYSFRNEHRKNPGTSMKRFRCFKCNQEQKSGVGHLSHLQICIVKEEDLHKIMVPCERCGSKLLRSSFKSHRQICRPQNDSTLTDTTNEALIIPRSRRSAALKAEKVIKELKDDVGESNQKSFRGVKVKDDDFVMGGDNDDEEEDDNIPYEGETSKRMQLKIFTVTNKAPSRRRVSGSIVSSWRRAMSNGAEGACLMPRCSFKSFDFDKLKDHFQHCEIGVEREYQCTLCAFKSISIVELKNHAKVIHGLVVDRRDDLIWGNVFPENGDCRMIGNKIDKFDFTYFWTLDFLKEKVWANYCFEFLKGDSESIPIDSKKLDDYLPSCRESVMVYSSTSDPCQFKLFQAESDENFCKIFLGGPIWSMAWAPTSVKQTRQFLAVSTHHFMDSVYTRKNVSAHPGLIQLWEFPHLSNLEKKPSTPKLYFALAHDYGAVWSMEWCPCAEASDDRIGLLAVAFSFGIVAVYSIPHPDKLLKTSSFPVYKLKPAVILDTQLEEKAQCTKISWQRVKPHGSLVAGFSNGFVCVWDLNTTSPLLKEDDVLFPYLKFQPHLCCITGLQFGTIQDNRYIVTCASDRLGIFCWDLKDTSTPVFNTIRSKARNNPLMTDMVWPNHWISLFTSADDAFCLGSGVQMNALREFNFSVDSVLPQTSATWSLSYSEWTGTLVNSSGDGNILLIAPGHLHKSIDQSKNHNLKRLVMKTHVVDRNTSNILPPHVKKSFDPKPSIYTEAAEKYGVKFRPVFEPFKAGPNNLRLVPSNDLNLYPLQSVNKVSWNPNCQSFLWLAMGYQNGFLCLSRKDIVRKTTLEEYYSAL